MVPKDVDPPLLQFFCAWQWHSNSHSVIQVVQSFSIGESNGSSTLLCALLVWQVGKELAMPNTGLSLHPSIRFQEKLIILLSLRIYTYIFNSPKRGAAPLTPPCEHCGGESMIWHGYIVHMELDWGSLGTQVVSSPSTNIQVDCSLAVLDLNVRTATEIWNLRSHTNGNFISMKEHRQTMAKVDN